MSRVGHLLRAVPKEPTDPLDRKVAFGTHADKSWRWVCTNEPSYVTWFLSGKCDVPRSEMLESALTEVMEARDMFPTWREEAQARAVEPKDRIDLSHEARKVKLHDSYRKAGFKHCPSCQDIL